MIDIHSHILPEIDDGARDWDEAVEMGKIAFKDGIHTIVATPHIKPGVYTSSKDLILSKVEELNRRLRQEMQGGRQEAKNTPASGLAPACLTILPGADNSFQADIVDQIENDSVLTIGTNNHHQTKAIDPAKPSNPLRYVLLELPDYFLVPHVKDLIKELRSKNTVPILSHPERNLMMQGNSKHLDGFIKEGALSQLTAMSITGEFGKKIKKFSQTLLKKKLVHIIASDAHSKDYRPPVLSRAVEEAAGIIGKDKAKMMVESIPQAIIEGKPIDFADDFFPQQPRKTPTLWDFSPKK